MSCGPTSFKFELLEKWEKILREGYEALYDISIGKKKAYSVDTSQSKITVTKHNITDLENILDRLLKKYEALYKELHGCSSGFQMVPNAQGYNC